MKNNIEHHSQPEEEVPRDESFSADYIRHSQSEYKTYEKILKERPDTPFDKDKQITPDLTESGIELATRSAESYFKELDPQNTALFFVSSNESRAIETADIYRKVAKSVGFDVIMPEHSRSSISDKIADGEIRIMNTLSLNHPNILANMAFAPARYRTGINFDDVPNEEKTRFEQATAIVDADDQGSYAKNYAKYSEQIKSIYPEIKSAHELYEIEFNNMKRLLRFSSGKVKESNTAKDVKILAFGHENMLMEALKEKFQEEEMGNCEILNIDPDKNNSFKGTFRGKESIL